MRGKAKWSGLLALVLVMSLFMLAACGGSSTGGGKNKNSGGSSTSGNYKQVLNLVDNQEIPTLDTTIGDDSVSFNVFASVFEGLYTMNAKNELVPALAVGDPTIKKENGNYVYTYKLQPNAKWSNGDPVTAGDFVYAWQRVVAKDSKATYQYLFPALGVLNADKITNKKDPMYGKVDKLGVKAVDDHTLQVTLTKQQPFVKSLMGFPTFFPQDKKYRESEGKKYGLEANTTVYNGPFVLSSWQHNQGWTYKKNPTYWDKKHVSLDQINVKVVKELTTSINLYNSGQIDHTLGLQGDWVQKYKNNPDFVKVPETTVFYLKFNEKNKYLKNTNIRKAMSMAIDKQAFVDTLLKNGSQAANYLVPKDFVKGPNGKDFRAKYGDLTSYNVAQAQKYWKQGLKELGVSKVSLNFLSYDGPEAKTEAQYIKNQLEKNLPGLSVSIQQQEFKTMLDLENNMKYDFVWAGWGPDYQDPMTFLDMFTTGNGNNQMAFSNKTYDAKIKFAETHTDPSQLQARWSAMQDAEKILVKDQAGLAPLYQRGSAFLTKPYVKNLVKHPFGPDYTFKYVSVTKH